MSNNVVQDVGKIWQRLFDHKSFLTGEISFVVNEFEGNRGDSEVDNLFSAIENITEIKESAIDRLKGAINETATGIRSNLEDISKYNEKIKEIDAKYQQDETLENERSIRKVDWQKFMDEITTSYSDINLNFEQKEDELRQYYKELEKKLQQ